MGYLQRIVGSCVFVFLFQDVKTVTGYGGISLSGNPGSQSTASICSGDSESSRNESGLGAEAYVIIIDWSASAQAD